MKHKHTVLMLAALVLLLLVQRGGLILYSAILISPHPEIDEPVSGVLPCDILDAQLRSPLFTYEYMNRSGDVLLEGIAVSALFQNLGRSIFSTKDVALISTRSYCCAGLCL